MYGFASEMKTILIEIRTWACLLCRHGFVYLGLVEETGDGTVSMGQVQPLYTSAAKRWGIRRNLHKIVPTPKGFSGSEGVNKE